MLDKKRTEFIYWNRPWHKWVVLVATLLQLPGLWMNIQEYNNISKIEILSAAEWASYASQKYWQCAIRACLKNKYCTNRW